jgi:hypothetical protein
MLNIKVEPTMYMKTNDDGDKMSESFTVFARIVRIFAKIGPKFAEAI